VPFICLFVSYLFWVSSLAYPNLLRIKGYVVVVVVVVVVVQAKDYELLFGMSSITDVCNT
jgi:hypothetical protein